MQDIGPDYKTKWIGKRFPKWSHFALEEAGVPASAFMANKKSQQAKARSSGDGPPLTRKRWSTTRCRPLVCSCVTFTG